MCCIGRLVIGFSQWFKKEFGVYPPRKMLVDLGKMSKAEREEYPWFWVYLWELGEQKGAKVTLIS